MKVKQNVPQIKSNYTKELLKFRGVENIDNFLNPNESDLESPFLLQNIEKISGDKYIGSVSSFFGNGIRRINR